MNEPNDNRPHLVAALENTRDLLCAFHRDHPERYQPFVKDALREGLVVLETEKGSYAFSDNFFSWQNVPSAQRGFLIQHAPYMFALLKDLIQEVECYCATEGASSKEPCLHCKAKGFITRSFLTKHAS